MEIRNRQTGAVITISEFKTENSNTSFPKTITAEILSDYGYDIVFDGAQATLSGPYEVSERNGVEQINGQWYTRFVVGPTFTDNDDETAAEQETAYRASVDARAGQIVREERDRLLADSDWTQLADSGADATAWATYRQALRDLPASDGFPHNVTWPTAP